MMTDPRKAIISGHLEHTGSKCGIRFAEITSTSPFTFTAQITITHDDPNASDDTINEALENLFGREARIECDVDENGDLTTTISRIQPQESPSMSTMDRATNLEGAIDMIASYKSGGLVDDEVSRERHEMIMIARSAQRGMGVESLKGLQQR